MFLHYGQWLTVASLSTDDWEMGNGQFVLIFGNVMYKFRSSYIPTEADLKTKSLKIFDWEDRLGRTTSAQSVSAQILINPLTVDRNREKYPKIAHWGFVPIHSVHGRGAFAKAAENNEFENCLQKQPRPSYWLSNFLSKTFVDEDWQSCPTVECIADSTIRTNMRVAETLLPPLVLAENCFWKRYSIIGVGSTMVVTSSMVLV